LIREREEDCRVDARTFAPAPLDPAARLEVHEGSLDSPKAGRAALGKGGRAGPALAGFVVGKAEPKLTGNQPGDGRQPAIPDHPINPRPPLL
jgi:hypothetical protein